MSVHRCALRPFALSDETCLDVGEWVCAPAGVINTSPEYYPTPDTFSGLRFVDPEILATLNDSQNPMDSDMPAHISQPKPSKLTDVDYGFLMWGTGRMAW